jgi:hypothetical protein
MRRLLVLLVTFILPLQLAWGAVTSYCQHETGPASHHFGHHEHVHKADPAKASADGGSGQDNDCGTCHAAAATALTGKTIDMPLLALRQAQTPVASGHAPSPAPQAPERPRWARLA